MTPDVPLLRRDQVRAALADRAVDDLLTRVLPALTLLVQQLRALLEAYAIGVASGRKTGPRRVLIAGVRVYALEFVMAVIGEPACRTHRWTLRLARSRFIAIGRRELDSKDVTCSAPSSPRF